MIDPNHEQLLTPHEVAKLPFFQRDGHPVAVSTVYRWIQRGVVLTRHDRTERVKLEYIRLPAGYQSSREAAERFIAALNSQAANPTGHPGRPAAPDAATSTSVTPTAAKVLAAAQLDALGI